MVVVVRVVVALSHSSLFLFYLVKKWSCDMNLVHKLDDVCLRLLRPLNFLAFVTEIELCNRALKGEISTYLRLLRLTDSPNSRDSNSHPFSLGFAKTTGKIADFFVRFFSFSEKKFSRFYDKKLQKRS